MRRIFCFLFFVFFLAACTLPQPNPGPDKDLIGTVVAGTLQAMTPQATPTLPAPVATHPPAATPTPSTAKVSGKVCYHDAGMLELIVYFQNAADGKVWTQAVSRPDETYAIEIPAGKYQVYAWTPDYTIGALVKGKPTVEVASAPALTDIDLCDYSQGPFAVPYPPGFTPSKALGSISGDVAGAPGSNGLTVVAFNKGTGNWYYALLFPGVYHFSIEDLPAGRYQVVAYADSGASGGTAPTVYVIAGQNTNADITDWAGNYPGNPVH
jgi:hypothetical protein